MHATHKRPLPSSLQPRKPLTDADQKILVARMQEAYGWEEEPRPHQLTGILAQLEGIDTIVQAPTGSGKTAIAAGPHLWLPGMITLMICPLLALEDEMICTFEKDFGLKAVAINSQNGALSTRKIEDILAGVYHIILISPEMIQSRSFVNRLLRNPAFSRKVLSVFIDEAHCISHWGADFRKKYGSLAVVRAFLPATTPVIAVSATLTRRVRRDIESKLHFNRNNKLFHNAGNNRANVSIIVRAMQHPLHTYADLDFVIPKHIASPVDIPKTFIYADNIETGNAIIDHLVSVLARRTKDRNVGHLNTDINRGIIRPFNASLSHEYRREAMARFQQGEIRIMVCTDAAGMGCNILDIDVVVQWKLPEKLSQWIQRAGRVARGKGRVGTAVLLVERSAYGFDLCSHGKQTLPARRKRGQPAVDAQDASKPQRKKSAAETKEVKKYAVNHGLDRGAVEGTDHVPRGEQPPLDAEAQDEGLLVFVQSTTCRRMIWAKVFENDAGALVEGTPKNTPCCDICDPSLLKRTRPGVPQETIAKAALPELGKADQSAAARLKKWRTNIFKRDHRSALFGPSAIFDDASIVLAVSVGSVALETLELLLKPKWTWWDRYGKELHQHLQSITIEYVPIKRKGRAQHPAQEETGVNVYTSGRLVHKVLHVTEPPVNIISTLKIQGFANYTVVDGKLNIPVEDVKRKRASKRAPRRSLNPGVSSSQLDLFTHVTFGPLRIPLEAPGPTMPPLQQPGQTSPLLLPTPSTFPPLHSGNGSYVPQTPSMNSPPIFHEPPAQKIQPVRRSTRLRGKPPEFRHYDGSRSQGTSGEGL